MRHSTGYSPPAKVWWTHSGWATSTPYNKNFVMELKLFSPRPQWDPTAKVWVFDFSCEKELKELLTKYYHGYDWQDKPKVPVVTSTNGNHFKTFVTLVGVENLKLAYKRAIFDLHPDRGGDATKATALNDAWRAIEEELKS